VSSGSRVASRSNRLVREQLAKERARRRNWITAIVAVIVLAIAGATGYLVYQGQRPAAGFAVPQGATADGIAVGQAAVRVDVYQDYLCPHCKAFESSTGATLKQLVADGKATVAYHPLAFLDDASTTKYSTRSAAAAACAQDAGKLVEYNDALYTNQPAEGSAGLSDDQLIQLAGTVGISTDAFGQCVHSGRYLDWVANVTDLAVQKGVTATPTVFVNGRQVDATAAAITAAVNAAS
jgi:protein-disulfide isomerase